MGRGSFERKCKHLESIAKPVIVFMVVFGERFLVFRGMVHRFITLTWIMVLDDLWEIYNRFGFELVVWSLKFVVL